MNDQIDKDLKAAMLAGDRLKTEALRGLKNALQYEAAAKGVKDKGLDEPETQKVLAREAKKRQEAADLYKQGGNAQKADDELKEKTIIEAYLPQQLSEEEIAKVVDEEVAKAGNPSA